MDSQRREFLRKSGAVLLGSAVGGSLSGLLSGCSDGTTSPLYGVEICPNTCTGCGTCLSSCSPQAIVLPRQSTFAIETAKCAECGDCLSVCPENAVAVAVKTISLDTSSCVGCGECITVCQNEGAALQWEEEYYNVNSNCRGHDCGRPCITRCPERAIYWEHRHAYVDPARCNRCGECLAVCPYQAITPARVRYDDGKCSRCGKCVEVCPYGALRSEGPSESFEPSINLDLCNRCGACETACTHGAIVSKIYQATVIPEQCNRCGACIPTCPFDAIQSV
jgi:ferredoxin